MGFDPPSRVTLLMKLTLYHQATTAGFHSFNLVNTYYDLFCHLYMSPDSPDFPYEISDPNCKRKLTHKGSNMG